MNKHHQHLERAKIVVLGKPKAGKSHGKTNVAKASKASAARPGVEIIVAPVYVDEPTAPRVPVQGEMAEMVTR